MAKTPVFTSDEAIAVLRQAVHSKAANFYAMYSSVLGGIVTDTALMVLPLDDHMVHRGHAVFDTATLTHGMLYQLDPHLDRLIQSADGARIPLPFSRERLRQIILETAAASRRRDGSVRYWLSAGPGGYGLGPAECVGSSFYVIVFKQEAYPESYYQQGVKL
ncbi:MAG TPA: aminotransferase class IV, partial [Candidatus Binatia bacterium]